MARVTARYLCLLGNIYGQGQCALFVFVRKHLWPRSMRVICVC